MSPAAIVSSAADLIEGRNAWTKHFTARGPIQIPGRPIDPEKDASCLPSAPFANQWSALGAIFSVGRKAGLTCADCYQIERDVSRVLGVDRLSDWNIRSDHSDVVAGLRRAALALEASA